MAGMTWPRSLVYAFAGATLLFAACGGGGGDDGAGKGPRATDPAKVATSTPISNAVLYSIKQDGSVSASGSAASATVPAQTPQAGVTATGGTTSTGGSYTVESGDTCAAIAQSHDISVDALLAANRTINCNNLRIGDSLKIPASTTAATPRPGTTPKPGTTPSSGGKTYVVESGDNCQAIADANGISLSALLSANPSIDSGCTNIKPGQSLKIP
jgi:LysM repeat protein